MIFSVNQGIICYNFLWLRPGIWIKYTTSHITKMVRIAVTPVGILRFIIFLNSFRLDFSAGFFLGARTVLDVGCADGMSLWVFRKVFGLRAYGIEASRWAAEHSVGSVRQFIVVGSIEDKDLRLPLEKFDVIVSFDTFEHLQPENLPATFKRVFFLTNTVYCSIYVLDELSAFVQNLFRVTHQSHFSEHSSAWWLDFFASQGAMATHIPWGRRGTMLVRRK